MTDAAHKTNRKRSLGDTVIRVVCAVAILIGLSARFAGLNRKFVGVDEVNTTCTLNGHPAVFEFFDRIVTAKVLMECRLGRSDLTVFDTIDNCRFRNPFNPPLYFVAARLWNDMFGGDLLTPRLVAAVISVFSIPGFYFLSLELFKSKQTALIITALSAVSPYFMQLAQFPRPYSLWIVFTLFSSALLLRALSRGKFSWALYSGVTVLSLYTHLSALRVLLGHILYGCAQKLADRKFPLVKLLISVVVSLIAFIPWVLELNAHLNPRWKGTFWFTVREFNHITLLESWYYQIVHLFFDIDTSNKDAQLFCSPIVLLAELVLVVVFLFRAEKSSRSFLLIMLLTTFATLAIPDLILGGDRTVNTRYMMPSLLVLLMMVGFGIATVAQSHRKVIRQSGIALLIFSLTVEVLSCWVVISCQFWWHAMGMDYFYAAQVVNRCKSPIVLGWKNEDSWPLVLISQMSCLRGDVNVGLTSSEQLLAIPEETSNVFIWEPTKKQLKRLKSDGVNCVRRTVILWEVVRDEQYRDKEKTIR